MLLANYLTANHVWCSRRMRGRQKADELHPDVTVHGDARLYDLTRITAMPDMISPPPSRPPPLPFVMATPFQRWPAHKSLQLVASLAVYYGTFLVDMLFTCQVITD